MHGEIVVLLFTILGFLFSGRFSFVNSNSLIGAPSDRSDHTTPPTLGNTAGRPGVAIVKSDGPSTYQKLMPRPIFLSRPKVWFWRNFRWYKEVANYTNPPLERTVAASSKRGGVQQSRLPHCLRRRELLAFEDTRPDSKCGDVQNRHLTNL